MFKSLYLKRVCNIRLFLFIFAVILLSGCITVYEKYTFNADGSGTMEYMIDMNEFFLTMQSFSEHQPNESLRIDQSFEDAALTLKKVAGISNIQITGNSENFIFGIKFDFSNVAALNQAMSYILQKKTAQKEFLSFKRKNITRHGVISDEFSKDRFFGEDEKELDAGMIKDVFGQIKYNIDMTFHRPVKSVNTKADFTIDKNKLSLKTDFGRLMDDNTILETKVRLK